MTKKCILHGGMPKTGSTSIQQAFFNFSSPDLVYAPLILAAHTFALWYLFDPNGKERVQALPSRKMPKTFRKQAEGLEERFKTFLEKNERDVLISSEVLVNSLLDHRERIVEFLKPYFDEIKFVAYVRAPEELIISSFSEQLKDRPKPFEARDASPRYKIRLKPWFDTLGDENISLTEFHPSRLHGGNVVLDLAARLGVNVGEPGNKQYNTAQSAEAVAIQQRWNRLLRDSELSLYERAKISFGRRQVLTFGKPKFGLDPELLRDICRENQQDIEWAEEKLGKPFVPYTPKSDAMLFHSEEQFSSFAKDAEKSFWKHVSDTWSWREHSVPALEALGRTILGEE